ncbi:hypothetical protein [Krasilnikovia sp. MM14-A1259]|uniref:hypothetical protein n=1 Tax=Krasilnikovia sp. MM14-A1259 TaxID=3373539 RepID=UPI0037FECFC7
MTVEAEGNEPNEFGFSGAGTGPSPEHLKHLIEDAPGGDVAVPAGDITGAVTHALEELVTPHDHEPEE